MGEGEGGTRIIQAVASLSDPSQCRSDAIRDAFAVEIRLDLMPGVDPDCIRNLADSFSGPIILTLRSVEEGGRFCGDADTWMNTLTPYLAWVSMVDVEIRYSHHASRLREMGISVIASCHTNEMLPKEKLDELYTQLRSYGDIPKIAVQPSDTGDLLTLLEFTHTAAKPVIVSVTGVLCRYARPLLPLFGSLFTYCYIDNPTSPGQYSLDEMKILGTLLSPAIMDTWFDGKPHRMEEE